MKERALRLVDDKGLLRLSSSVACSALTLLEFLVTFDDTSRVKTRGRYLMVGACEHLRNLNEGQCDDLTEPVCVPERVSNGTLLWMVYTRDALVALLGGRPSCLYVLTRFLHRIVIADAALRLVVARRTI